MCLIIFHELIHYAYKCCITNIVHGEKRTNAWNNGTSLIKVRFKKKTMYEKI